MSWNRHNKPARFGRQSTRFARSSNSQPEAASNRNLLPVLQEVRGGHPPVERNGRSCSTRFDLPSGMDHRAFTLIELMVVIVIVGVLASIAIPAMKGLGQANRSSAAHRQILDDLGLARLRAINDRCPVYMVFVPPNVAQAFNRVSAQGATPRAVAERRQLTNLLNSAYAAYALISDRTVGDQPGRHTRHYLTEWRALPEGTIFAPYKLAGNAPNLLNEYNRTLSTNLTRPLPFPNSQSEPFLLPYIGFNSQGQLMSQRDEIITLAKGSVLVINGKPDVQLNPPVTAAAPAAKQTNTYQFVRVNWLTGRSKVELPDFTR